MVTSDSKQKNRQFAGKNVEPLEQISLCDGAQLLYLPDERYKTARITFSFLVPLREETAAANALIPGLLTRACAACPDFTSLNRQLAMLYGAWVGGRVRKIGETQALTITLSMLDERYAPDGAALAQKGAELLRNMIFRPALNGKAFRTEDFEQERRQLCEELDSEFNDKRIYAKNCAEALLCSGEAYAVPRIGTKEQLLSLTPKDAFDAWDRLLHAAQIRVTAIGTDTVRAAAMEFAGELRGLGTRTPVDCRTELPRGGEEIRRSTERSELSQCKMVMGFCSTVAEPDEMVPAMRLFCALFGGTPHSRLFLNVREKLSLCYYCAAHFVRAKGILLVESGVEEQNAARAEEEILHQFKALQTGDFTEEELENVRRSVCDSFCSVSDSPVGMDEWLLQQCMLPNPEMPEETEQKIRAVTKEQIVAAANSLKPGAVFLLAGTVSGEKGEEVEK